MAYIDREKFLNRLGEEYPGIPPHGAIVVGMLCDEEPADVRPVVRGTWEWNETDGTYHCSECCAVSPMDDQDGESCDCPNFCYNCGALMEG